MRAVPPCLAVLLLLSFVLGARAEDQPPTLPDAVRQAVAARQLQDSDNIGDASLKASLREIAGEGGVLVGLDVGLAQSSDREIPYTIRPIYREGKREWTGGWAGSPGAREVRRTVRSVAKPGYAVGGMWVRGGAGLDRICLLFMRVENGHLDRADAYPGDWVGTSDGGSEKYLDGRGFPVVGLFANASRDQARNFGFIFAKVSVPDAKKKVGDPTDAVPPPRAIDDNNPAGEGPSKLSLEAAALREQREAAGSSVPLILLALLGILGVPLAILGYFLIGRNEPPKTRQRDPDDVRQRKLGRRTQPINERPELARRLQPYLPAAMAKNKHDGLGDDPSDDLPPFFLARATYRARFQRMTRVYVLPDEILLIDAGPGADRHGPAGGALGALAGGAVGTMVADDQKARGEVLQKRLDALSLPALFNCSSEDGNLRSKFEDIIGLTIDPPAGATTRSNERNRSVGTLRFRHVRRGEHAFEFLCPAELRGAAELLRQAAGANLHLGTEWDEATAGYLTGL